MREKGISLRGHIKVVSRDILTGETKVLADRSNLILDDAITILAERVASSDPDKRLAYVAFGTGDSTPTTGDTELDNEVDTVEIHSFVAEPGGQSGVVELHATLEQASSANGHTLQEMGLLTDESPKRMFARQLLGSIEKTENIALEITWILEFNLPY